MGYDEELDFTTPFAKKKSFLIGMNPGVNRLRRWRKAMK